MNVALQAAGSDVRRTRDERPRVLIVDDDPSLLRGYAKRLAGQGCRVETASSGDGAMVALKECAIDVIVSDLQMPGMNGLELLEAVRAVDPDVPLVLITGCPTLQTATAAIEQGVLRYLAKPVDSRALVDVVIQAKRLHDVARAKRQALELAGGFDQVVTTREALDSRLTSAMDTLFMAFQPIVSWSTREVFGYEALLRSREKTLPHPGAMLDAAERLNRTRQLGRIIRARACQPLAHLPSQVSLFVNLHTRDLLDDQLFSADAPLTQVASRVVLEITERASLDEVPDVQSRVARLREMGFRIAVDDLGAGYAGLTSFALLEPEIVKLDMSLVRGIHEQPTKRTLVRTMVGMCKELGMTVVGEGVESAEERDVLAELECGLMQGYLFARPDAGFPEPRW